jgi:hypothetical protein
MTFSPQEAAPRRPTRTIADVGDGASQASAQHLLKIEDYREKYHRRADD